MQLIVLTDAEMLFDEAKKINHLFDNGLELLHIRKPEVDVEEIRELLLEINPAHLGKIVVHEFHELAIEFRLKGIHVKEHLKRDLKDKLKPYTRGFRDTGFTVSASFHSKEDLVNNKVKYDYVFLSPVFDSISKENHEGKQFNVTDLNNDIIALGGVTVSNISRVKELGYSGIATIGTIWNSENPVTSFLALKTATSQLVFK